jgi:trans-aconitate methyltransferase
MDDLTRIGIREGTDKSYYHTFTRFYEPYFRPLRNNPITILEIGISEGASLRMMQTYFPHAQIHAIDVNPASIRNYGDRVHTYLCSQTDLATVTTLFGDMEFDIIIDDGSHVTSHQQMSLGFLFPRLKPGGLYICEDIHTSFVQSRVDTPRTTLDLLQSKSFESPHIPSDAQSFLAAHVANIEVYQRTTLPYRCWKCKSPTHICRCGLDAHPTPRDSQTAILVRTP